MIAVAVMLAVGGGIALAVFVFGGGNPTQPRPRPALPTAAPTTTPIPPTTTAPNAIARVPRHNPRQSPPWGFTGSGWPTGGGWPDLCYGPVAASATNRQGRVPDTQPCRPGSRRITADTQIALTARAGADVDRLDAIWATIEPLPPSEAAARGAARFNWAPLVSRYQAMIRDGIRPIVVAYGAPVWARTPGWDQPGMCTVPGGGCSFPPAQRHLPQWRAFVRGLVDHLPKMRALEVWNEPNYERFFAPHPEPGRYAQLLQAADHAARGAGFRGPIITGGLAAVRPAPGKVPPPEFLTRVYETAGKRAFDGIGAHPYPDGPPWTASMIADLDQLRNVSERFGDGSKPLWITEVGIGGTPSGGKHFDVPLGQQGPLLASMYRAVQRLNVRSFLVYQLYDFNDQTSRFATYGVMTPSVRPKPAYCYVAEHIGGTHRCPGARP